MLNLKKYYDTKQQDYQLSNYKKAESLLVG
jgi:hypothetical protein